MSTNDTSNNHDPITPIVAGYTNYRGETDIRRFVPLDIIMGVSAYHGDAVQPIVIGYDVDKDAIREFSLYDFTKIAGVHEKPGVPQLPVSTDILRTIDAAISRLTYIRSHYAKQES